MPSKYGGIPVDEPRSKFGGIPVDDDEDTRGLERLGGTPPPAATPFRIPAGLIGEPESIEGAGNGPGIPKIVNEGLHQFVGAIPAFANKAPARGAADAIEGASKIASPLAIPAIVAAPVASSLAIAGGAGTSALAGAGARAAGASRDTERLARIVGSFPGAIAGGRATPVLRRIAEPIAESALGIRGQSHAYGANPGAAILDETTGVRPGRIGDSAQSRITDLTAELENRSSQSNKMADLTPARQVISRIIGREQGGNSTAKEMQPMASQLNDIRQGFAGRTEYAPGAATPITPVTKPSALLGPNGQPANNTVSISRGTSPDPVVAAQQPPTALLNMKRQFDRDFITNWNPTKDSTAKLDAAKQVYGSLADSLNDAVPGAADLNNRISSLIPVARRGKVVSLNAGPVERIADRVARPTGALAPALMGLHTGGVPGLISAITGQEMLAAPTAKLFAARALSAASRPITPVGAAITGAASVARRRTQ